MRMLQLSIYTSILKFRLASPFRPSCVDFNLSFYLGTYGDRLPAKQCFISFVFIGFWKRTINKVHAHEVNYSKRVLPSWESYTNLHWCKGFVTVVWYCYGSFSFSDFVPYPIINIWVHLHKVLVQCAFPSANKVSYSVGSFSRLWWTLHKTEHIAKRVCSRSLLGGTQTTKNPVDF
jgi:hypothetical protein